MTIAKLAEEKRGPALLFGNIYERDPSPSALYSVFSNTRRLATVLGRRADMSID